MTLPNRRTLSNCTPPKMWKYKKLFEDLICDNLFAWSLEHWLVEHLIFDHLLLAYLYLIFEFLIIYYLLHHHLLSCSLIIWFWKNACIFSSIFWLFISLSLIFNPSLFGQFILITCYLIIWSFIMTCFIVWSLIHWYLITWSLVIIVLHKWYLDHLFHAHLIIW